MFDIMKNSRLYKFLRKIAGDEVSITPANVLEDCLDDIAEAIGEGGGSVTVLDTFPLTEAQIAAVVANPEKYIIKYSPLEGVTAYYRISAVASTSLYAVSFYRVSTTGNDRALHDRLTISRTTGECTASVLVTGHSDAGVTALANAAIVTKFTFPVNEDIVDILNVVGATAVSLIQANVSIGAVNETSQYTLPEIPEGVPLMYNETDVKAVVWSNGSVIYADGVMSVGSSKFVGFSVYETVSSILGIVHVTS